MPPAHPGAAEPDPLPHAQIEERGREAQRLHKVLEDAGIKLDCVATDILGVSGRAMLEALVRARPTRRCWRSSPGAVCGPSCPRCAKRSGAASTASTRLIGASLAHLDFLDEAIDRLSEADRGADAPFRGGGCASLHHPRRRAAHRRAIVAEIGVDMSGFPERQHLASWAGLARATTSPPARAARAHPQGLEVAGRALIEAALAATAPRTPTSPPSTSASPRRGHKKALVAANTRSSPPGHMLTTGEVYRELGGDYFQTRRPDVQVRP